MNRRAFFLTSCSAASLLAPSARSADSEEPWSKTELLASSDLVKRLHSREQPHILCVAFPVLYRQKHIAGATLAGPGGKPEGIAALRTAVADLPKSAAIVIYCGCCPMGHCPNIRPAYRTLKELGYNNLWVLDIPTNFHTDWVAKNYPVD